MKIFGKTGVGGTPFELPADYKRAVRVRTPALAVRVPKLTVYCDGLGSGFGNQPMRAALYTITGVLLAQGDEVVILDGQSASWVDLRFSKYPGGVPLLPATAYDFTLHAGPPGNVIRVFGDPSAGV